MREGGYISFEKISNFELDLLFIFRCPKELIKISSKIVRKEVRRDSHEIRERYGFHGNHARLIKRSSFDGATSSGKGKREHHLPTSSIRFMKEVKARCKSGSTRRPIKQQFIAQLRGIQAAVVSNRQSLSER